MDKDTRNSIQRATQAARRLLEDELSEQLGGMYDIRSNGTIAAVPGAHLREDPDALRVRGKLVTAVQHHRDQGRPPAEAVAALLRECAFTTLNRFVALKMLEARGIVQECVSKGPRSSGFREFSGLAAGLTALPDQGYRLYIDSLFDEIGREVRVLFDRRDPASLLWPRKPALDALLGILNDPELAEVWGEDETIGWVYQYFNGEDERRLMRAESQAPRNSRELAVRNQFFTPRYVVEFLTDNTLARTWVEMRQGDTRLVEDSRYLVKRKAEVFLADGEQAPEVDEDVPLEERTVYVPFRAKKDPRDLRVLDPACGSGHFLLYSFDVLLTIYEEAWADADSPASEVTGRRLAEDYATLQDLRRALPGLILRHNLHGVDIDPRAAQIAALALWMRAQRAWNELGFKRADRPLVTRTNIVVAEPMPGEADLLEELCADLDRGVADIVRAVFEDMKLAGEAGTLLRIEETVRRGLEKLASGGLMFAAQDAARWAQVEDTVYAALRSYAEGAGQAGYRKRLFAGDTARGFALIELLVSAYDVVLMNPPFGEPTTSIQGSPGLRPHSVPSDLYCMFVARGVELAPDGTVGAITSSSFLLYTDYQSYRSFLSTEVGMPVLVDMGWGVLDAYVQTAMYCLGPAERNPRDCLFVDSAAAVKSGAPAGAALLGLSEASAFVYPHAMDAFAAMSGSPFCYWFPESFLRWIPRAEHVSDYVDEHGIGAGPRNYFFRLRWELPDSSRCDTSSWPVLSNGGSFSPFYRDNALHIAWRDNGAQVRAHIDTIYPYLNGNVGIKIQRTHVYGRPGLTYGKRTDRFNAQVLASGAVPSFNGIGLYPASEGDRWWLLGFLNSRFSGYFLNATCGLHKNSVYIDRIPIPEFSSEARHAVGEAARKLYYAAVNANSVTETDAFFAGPAALRSRCGRDATLQTRVALWRKADRQLEVGMWRDLWFVETAVIEALGLSSSVVEAIEADQGRLIPADVSATSASVVEPYKTAVVLADPKQPFRPVLARDDSFAVTDLCRTVWGTDVPAQTAAELLDEADHVDDTELAYRVEDLISWVTGVVVGRFDVRLGACHDSEAGRHPFDAVPLCSPAMLTGVDGLAVSAPPCDYPIEYPTNGLLVDDPGAERDLLARIRSVVTVVFGEYTDDRLNEARDILDPKAPDLRPWLRSKFFELHIKRYSKSRRKAPIYWQLGTPSASYSVWLYIHRTGPDTLHTVLRDHVEPKLRFETNRLAALRSEAGDSPAPSQRKDIEAQEAFVDELRAFRDELKRVAPLWNPNLDDGVVINASFLHRLFAHTRSWQTECEKHWKNLKAGDYDWAHLAMRLWPERVVTKCADDRSLAIAHGLEDVFWFEDDDGRWQTRDVDDATIERLVRERTSPAVKDALKQVAAAPPPPKAKRGVRRRAAPRRARSTSAPAPRSSQIPLGLAAPAAGPSAATLDALRAALHQFPDGAGKSDLLSASGIDEGDWKAGIDALVDSGEVERTGRARGTRYHLARRT